jgi:hypothetical protein
MEFLGALRFSHVGCSVSHLTCPQSEKPAARLRPASRKQRQQSFAELSVLPTISKPVSINKEVFEPSLEAIKARYYAKFSKGGKVPEEAAEEEYVLAPTSGGEAGPALAPAPAPAHTPAASPTRRSPRRASAPAPPQPLGLETLAHLFETGVCVCLIESETGALSVS